MAGSSGRVPKPYRHRLHRLKNAYRKAYRREPDIPRPITEEAARQAIAFLERELRRAGMDSPPERRSGSPRQSR